MTKSFSQPDVKINKQMLRLMTINHTVYDTHSCNSDLFAGLRGEHSDGCRVAPQGSEECSEARLSVGTREGGGR